MPQSNSWRDLIRLVLFTFAAWALWALGRNDAKPGAVDATETTETTRKRSGFSKRRLATSLAFATLFFSGAAFTAGAGNQIASALDTTQSQSSDAPAATSAGGETSDSEPATGPAAAPTAAPAPEAAAPAADPNAIAAAVEAAVLETGASGPKDMGKVMKAVMARLGGMSVDGRMVSDAVKKRLSG